VPIYTNVSNFLSSLGLKDERQQIYIAVVDQTGKVLIAVQGDYDAAKAQAVLSQLKNPVKPD
jgi:predicted transcriptional regulator